MKRLRIELAGNAAEGRIVADLLRDQFVRQVEAELTDILVERCFRDHLAEQLPVQTERARLIGGDRLADLPDQPLHLFVVGLPEPLDADLGRADFGDGGGAEAAEDVADAPDRERDRDQAQQDSGDQAAKPIAGSVLNSAQHESSGSFVVGDEVKRTGIIEIAV